MIEDKSLPPTDAAVVVPVPGAELTLLPDKAIFWQSQSALLIADVHFGKAAAFRAHSIAVPGGTTATDLGRIAALLDKTGARSLYILGDMWHAKEGFVPQTLDLIRTWRSEYEHVEVTLVMGNHDRKCGNLPNSLRVNCVEEPFQHGSLTLAHDPAKMAGEYSLAGHVHPCVRLEGLGGGAFPCFWFGDKVALLPAFGSFTGCAKIRPGQDDDVFIVVDGKVIGLE